MKRYSLIELVIAVSIFSLIALSCLGLLNFSTSSLESQIDRSKHILELEKIDRYYQKIVINAIVYHGVVDDLEMASFSGTSQQLKIISKHQINDCQIGGIRFQEVQCNGNHQLVVRYKDRPNGKVISSIIAENIDHITFRYAFSDSINIKNWQIQWLDVWTRKDLPLAIQMNVTWREGQTEIFMYRVAGHSAYEHPITWQVLKRGEK